MDSSAGAANASGNPSPGDGTEARGHHLDPEEDPNARQCRFCYDYVLPTYEQRGNRPPRRVYHSKGDGYLISPCLCKGGLRYVHENCLQEWRYSMAGTDGQFQCPTCKYQYQLGRLTWANTLKSPIVAFFLAVSIVALSIFLLGFVADPIISLWLDPVATVGEGMGLFDSDAEGEFPLRDLDEEGWSVHFVKGMFSLGLLGFVKAFFAMGPFQWWNLRSSGVIGGGARRRGGTGRDRMENINLYLVLIGVVTFFWAVWTGTRNWTQRTLDMASQKVLNVQKDEEDEEQPQAEASESRTDH
ncbi:RING finger domain-containing protein [Apiospora kogelbergensis]|uniref:RING finger domain-containing protein n=1 Tax=Apiospora kogelbergensis TaxID=1337665 RepID=A0AAW0R8X5_9PEZI